jgi:hypothetical protein
MPARAIVFDDNTFSLAVSETESDAVYVGQGAFIAIFVPSNFTGASFTFQGSSSKGGTYAAIHDEGGGAFSITPAAKGVWISFSADAAVLAPFPWLKIVANTAQLTTAASFQVMYKE